ncbi:MAG: PTS cellobiose transporter subunit IIB [Erysipelotrichaceae bacterium]|nr:PTS cellobiose transporter subunit IIB [Erysipelotrichaceae bacterium]
MKRILIVCAGGMSSSLVAKKAEEKLQSESAEISITARGVGEGKKLLKAQEYDLYLISPQTKNYMKEFEKLGEEAERKVVAIPPQAYIPVPVGTDRLCKLILSEME